MGFSRTAEQGREMKHYGLGQGGDGSVFRKFLHEYSISTLYRIEVIYNITFLFKVNSRGYGMVLRIAINRTA